MIIEQLMDQQEMSRRLGEMAEAMWAMLPDPANGALIGIRTRGAHLAERFQGILAERHGFELPLGMLGITLYRDDLSQLAPNPVVRDTELDFDINDRTLLLIDDVLYTGRTIRSALDELVDFGRPRAIRLGVLVDRGGHEYPIQADYAALTLDVPEDQVVKVCLSESDDSEKVVLVGRESARA